METLQPMASAIYRGWIRHRRFAPREHQFEYRLCMLYFDLEELQTLIQNSRWCSTGRWGLACFRRADYLGDSQQPLQGAVRELVWEQLGVQINGPIRMLTHLRYCGFIINPITIYYCFDASGQLQALVLDVTNTPWGESHPYVLRCNPNATTQRITFDKQLHVSPFHPMQQCYHFNGNIPGQRLVVHLQNAPVEDVEKTVFDATLCLQREPMTAGNLDQLIVRYPWMTLKVAAAIYWQALRLLFKKVPLHPHPH